MVRKNSHPTADQGALFSEHVVRSGETDPAMQKVNHQYEVAPDGVMPEQQPKIESHDFGDPELVKAVHEAIKTDNRRAAQRGKHSPMQRSGFYGDAVPGDVLPGFGIVYKNNLREARAYGAKLDEKRQ